MIGRPEAEPHARLCDSAAVEQTFSELNSDVFSTKEAPTVNVIYAKTTPVNQSCVKAVVNSPYYFQLTNIINEHLMIVSDGVTVPSPASHFSKNTTIIY